MLRLIASALVMLCVGCTIPEKIEEKKAKVIEFGLADAKAALNLAIEQKDPIAEQCHRYIIAKIEERLAAKKTDKPDEGKKGVLYAFQKARGLRRRIQKGFSEEFKIACSPLKDDSKGFLKLGLPI